jgi:hypothetical protein
LTGFLALETVRVECMSVKARKKGGKADKLVGFRQALDFGFD